MTGPLARLQLIPLKNVTARRDLPLLPVAQTMLDLRRQARAPIVPNWSALGRYNGLVFTTRTGRPVELHNLVRSSHRICRANKLRPVKVRHLRHATATLLKKLGVPARDAQIIPGHARLAVTLEIYTHEDRQAQRDTLGRISDARARRPSAPRR